MEMSAFKRVRSRAARTRWRVPLIWLRHRGLCPADVFLASYPRSGQYWLRFLLGEILTGESGEFDSVDKLVPRVGVHGRVPATLPGGGRLIQTHEGYRKQYGKAVYLVRDLRDVVLSEYDYVRANHRPYMDQTFDQYLSATLRGEVQAFYRWNDHVCSWLDSPIARRGDLLVVKFEDLRRNPEKALLQILEFLRVSPDLRVVRKAIANNSLDRMRAKEDSRQTKKSSREEDRHVRSGSVGRWREKLTDFQVRLIEQYAREALTRLEYPLAGQDTRDQQKETCPASS